jgi:DNA repair exonuclease SbcCD nuclease subunit
LFDLPNQHNFIMRIIHLSDLHINNEKLKHDLPLLWKALVNDLKKHTSEKSIDLIVITGDIIDRGGVGLDNTGLFYGQVAENLINKLAKAIALPKERFILIPGNHDVVEPVTGHKVREANNAYQGLVNGLKTLDEVNRFINEQVKVDDPHLVVKRLTDFRQFVKLFHAGTDNNHFNNIYTAHIVELSEAVKVGVAAFNTAWACHKDHALKPEKVILGTAQIIEAGNFFQEKKTDFNIALFHHPLSDLSDDEQDEIETLFNNYDFSLLMCGHYHSEKSTIEKRPNDELLHLRANAVFSKESETDKRYIAGYSVLDFRHGTDNEIAFRLQSRKYNRSRSCFVADNLGAAGEAGEYQDKFMAKSSNTNFIDFLRAQTTADLPQPMQKRVSELSQTIEKGFRNLLPGLPEDKLKLLEQKLFPKDKLYFFKQNHSISFEISQVDKNHFCIKEKQKFTMVTSRKNVSYDTYIYQEKEDSRRDKSSLEIKKLKINGKSHLKQVEIVDTITETGSRKVVYKASTVLPEAGSYEVERDIVSINSLIHNGIWKLDIRSVVAGLSLKIKNVNNYLVDVVEFGNNTTFTKDIKEMPNSGVITTEEHDLLLPGDGFLIVVRNK